MKRTAILRTLCMVVAALVVALGVITITQPGGDRTVIETAAPSSDAPAPTSTTTPSSTTTTVEPTTTTVPPTTVPSTTVPPTTVPPTTVPPTTVPPTTVPPPTTAPPTTVPEPPPAEPTSTTLRRGDRGPAVLALQRRLQDLGYWLGGVSQPFGPLTEQAVIAFQKVEGLSPDGIVGPATRAALDNAGRPSTSASGDLIEVDKARQVLFVVRDGAVLWALNTSTGTEQPYQINGRTEMADTPPGHWTVDWVVDGVDVGALGALYRPRYFHHDGIAVHGYHSVPTYPASHGCVRVTEAAMDWVWAQNLMPLGSEVWVH